MLFPHQRGYNGRALTTDSAPNGPGSGNRLSTALRLALQYRQSGRTDADTFMAEHAELRDPIEPMIRSGAAAADEPADPAPASSRTRSSTRRGHFHFHGLHPDYEFRLYATLSASVTSGSTQFTRSTYSQCSSTPSAARTVALGLQIKPAIPAAHSSLGRFAVQAPPQPGCPHGFSRSSPRGSHRWREAVA